MQSRKLFCLAALLATTAPALAGDFYVVGALGSSRLDSGGESTEDLLNFLGLTNVSDKKDEHSTGYKLQFGYQLHPNLAIEAGWVDLGNYSYELSATNFSARGTVSGHGFSVSGVATAPINESWGALFRLGVIHAQIKSDILLRNTGTGASTIESPRESGLSPLIGVGVQYRINRNVDLRFELEQYRNLGKADTTGEGDVRMYSLGAALRF